MPILKWQGHEYTIAPLTMGEAKKCAKAMKELENKGEMFELIGEYLGTLHCPQDVADACEVGQVRNLIAALEQAHMPEEKPGGGQPRPQAGVPADDGAQAGLTP